MGNKSSAKRKVIRTLTEETYFNEKELQVWYNKFMKECPDGELGREQFNEICAQLFPYGDTTKFSEYFFLLFDQNNDGCIDFFEFIMVVSPISRGTLDERIRWTFRLYDQDGDGFVSREDMFHIVESIYQMVDTVFKFPFEENTPEKRVAKIFSMMDKRDDTGLSLEDFMAGCKSDGRILRALSGYDDIG